MPRLDRFWWALESVPGRACLTVEWRDLLGADYEHVQRFLAPTNHRGQAYPCPNPAGDGCPRRIVAHDEDHLVAVCGDSPRRCESVTLAREDLIVYEVDVAALASEVAAALAIRPQVQGTGISTWRVGEYIGAGSRLPTYLTIRISGDEVDAVVRELLLVGDRPFLLLAPMSRLLRLRSRELLGSAGCIFAALEELIQVGRDGHLVGRVSLSDFVVAAGEAAAVDEGVVFRRDGDKWTLRYEGVTAYLNHRGGLRYLQVLLASPGREYHPADLATAAGEGPARRAISQEDDLALGGLHSTGEVLDDRARDEYRERLAVIDKELAQARDHHDLARIERLQDEKEMIGAELRSAYGLHGRPRTTGDPRKNARDRVTAAIRRARGAITKEHPALSEHLDAAIRQGPLWSYQPAASVSWLF